MKINTIAAALNESIQNLIPASYSDILGNIRRAALRSAAATVTPAPIAAEEVRNAAANAAAKISAIGAAPDANAAVQAYKIARAISPDAPQIKISALRLAAEALESAAALEDEFDYSSGDALRAKALRARAEALSICAAYGWKRHIRMIGNL